MKARRSCLSVPARPARKLEKARGLGADEIILDLEDSVPPDLKPEARDAVAAALAEDGWLSPSISVRINGPATPWHEDDLRAIGTAPRLASVIVPKVEDAADLGTAEELLGGSAGIQALIESAQGLQRVDEVSSAGGRLETLILGPADMSVSLGFPSPEEGSRWDFVRGAILVAARAAGLQAIDGPFLQIADLDGLRASAQRARGLGFDGKWALHPDQIEPLNEAFSPSAEEIEQARAITEALRDSPASGAVMLNGEMIDAASRKRAELVLARAEAASTL
ncbi:MAG: HpcH/HpaI aldolase/citrate lyase family protein [Solirubrobacterales bacterium]